MSRRTVALCILAEAALSTSAVVLTSPSWRRHSALVRGDRLSCESFCGKRDARAAGQLCSSSVDQVACQATFEADADLGSATPCAWACHSEPCVCEANSNATIDCKFSPEAGALAACASGEAAANASTTTTTTDGGSICGAFCLFTNLRAKQQWCANISSEENCSSSYVTTKGLTVPCAWSTATAGLCEEDHGSALMCAYTGTRLEACGGVAPVLNVTNATSAAATAGMTIPNSNRTAATPCDIASAELGDECSYECMKGYLAVGRHVYQDYEAGGNVIVNSTFFGGRCERLCPANLNASCGNGTVPLRSQVVDGEGPCLNTTCLDPDAALRHIARGNYEVWRKARNPRTGVYINSYDLGAPSEAQAWSVGDAGATGIGVAFECLAHAMGWISLNESQSRILQTLRSMTSNSSDFTVSRGPFGWLPRAFDSETGHSAGARGSVAATGVHFAGLLVARTYFQRMDPDTAATFQIANLTDVHIASVEWGTIREDEEKWDNETAAVGRERGWVSGLGIPFAYEGNGSAVGTNYPRIDGFYEFSELMPAVWLAHEGMCGSNNPEGCGVMEQTWERWQGRRNHPSQSSENGTELLSRWSSYVVQLPQYLVHAFGADERYQELFHNAWQADQEHYAGSSHHAGGHIYGLGAGRSMPWCSNGSAFTADSLDGQGAGCRTWSPYAIAGYLPTAPETVEAHLLQIMAEGSAVGSVPGTSYHVLGRRSLADPTWRPALTMVDFSSELFGLSTKWLGMDFWLQNTAHWKTPIVKGTMRQELDDIEGKFKTAGNIVSDAISSVVSPAKTLGKGLRDFFGASADEGSARPEKGHAEVLDAVTSFTQWTSV